MDKEQLAKLIAEKIDAAQKSSEHPKKFFITENGRGVTDGGDLYNAVLNDVLGVVKIALVEIFQELAATPEPQPAPAPVAKSAPAAKSLDKKSSKK